MMDPVSLATAAVAVLSPYLVEGGKEVTKTAGKDLYAWIKGRFTGPVPVAEAMDDLEANPTLEDNRADLRKRLAKALAADPSLVEELKALLPEATGTGATTQTIDQSRSTGAKAAQVSGNQNTTSIG
ncbi:hypothetical protein N825_25245 [Skermanella stibiiresistens SB22]|uniref:Uncharacterized protein n=1 Tax=Skermanella stibiiresistens SB22 TaxID=1385369 RepID=W9GWC5_9PROT|nr:hypothetical protein [Skermanella stibiiresistens]EWY36742.1 hypothetical protein N825_25245 [Skermanella stibiiresistens SB22]